MLTLFEQKIRAQSIVLEFFNLQYVTFYLIACDPYFLACSPCDYDN